MNQKTPTERRKQIIDICRQEGIVTIPEACELFPHVSERTITRDLQTIADEYAQIVWEPGRRGTPGKIRSIPHEYLSYRERLLRNVPEKQEIAKIAAMFARGADVIFIDSGTTSAIFLDFAIKDGLIRRLKQIYTTSLDIADKLAEWQATADISALGYLIGGPIRSTTRNLTGKTGWKALPEDLRFDVAFIDTPGVDNVGFLTQYLAEADIKLEAINRANVAVLLADYSKFNQDDINQRFANQVRSYFGCFNSEPSCKGFYLISDDGLSNEDKERLEAAEITVFTDETFSNQIRVIPKSGLL